ncbi:unnamed protein product, partial [marine sediment metagenome]
NWPLPTRAGNIFPVRQGTNLGEQVLKDLTTTEDEIEKLEILDSYAAYSQRAYQQQVAVAISFLAGRILDTLLEPNILSHLPAVDILSRGRPATKE